MSGWESKGTARQGSKRLEILDQRTALVRRQVADGGCIATLRQQFAAAAANGLVRIVVNLATAEIRQLRIEQREERIV